MPDLDESRLTPADRALYRALVKLSPVDVQVAEHLAGPHFDPSKGITITPEYQGRPSVVSHEIGHAEIDRSPTGWLYQNLVGNLLYGTSGLAGLVPAMTGKTWGHVAAGAALPWLVSVPRLLAEHRAWTKGRALMERLDATPRQLAVFEAVKAKALGTYYVLPTLGMAQGLGLGLLNKLSGDTMLYEKLARVFGLKVSDIQKIVPGKLTGAFDALDAGQGAEAPPVPLAIDPDATKTADTYGLLRQHYPDVADTLRAYEISLGQQGSINDAFDVNANVDRKSTTPEPGVVYNPWP